MKTETQKLTRYGFSKYGMTSNGNAVNITTGKIQKAKNGKVRLYNDKGTRTTVSLEHLRELVNGVEPKAPKTKKTTKQESTKTAGAKTILSLKDSEKIKEIVAAFKKEEEKKTIIVSLLKSGFTKQQLDKYRPEIAHWSYIYQIAKQLGK